MSNVIANRETLIKKLVKNKASASAGRAFKFIGTAMLNGPDLLEAAQVQVEEEAKEYAKRLSKVNMKGSLSIRTLLLHITSFCGQGDRSTSLNIQILTSRSLQISSSFSCILLPQMRLYLNLIHLD